MRQLRISCDTSTACNRVLEVDIFRHKQKFSDFLKLILLITLVQAAHISTTFEYFLDWVRYWLYVDDVAV